MRTDGIFRKTQKNREKQNQTNKKITYEKCWKDLGLPFETLE